MSTKIEQLIDEIDDYIESCKPKMLSGNIILVNKDEIQELLRDLRMKTPEEIKKYQKIISNREAIMNDARQRADAIVQDAAIHTNELISDSEIVQQAQSRADEMIQAATQQAQEILDRAAMEANAMRQAAVDYTDAQLRDLENKIGHAVDIAALNYDKLIAQLNEDLAVIQENRTQLYPPEDETQEDMQQEYYEDTNVNAGGLDVL